MPDWPHLAGIIVDGRHVLAVRVYYEDTDFSGLVYHASYLRFMERGRTDYMRLIGVAHREMFEEANAQTPGFAFVVRSMQIDFLKPARMDDILEIHTHSGEIRGASITLEQEVVRSGEPLTRARVRVALIAGGKAQRIPKLLRDALTRDAQRVGQTSPPKGAGGGC
jgi:acyl-CoA thioester hydrolase